MFALKGTYSKIFDSLPQTQNLLFKMFAFPTTGLPGVFFFYEISPLHVEIVEGYRKGYIAFFTSVCAIVGGVVTTMGLLDQMLHSQSQKKSRGQGLVH